MTTCQLELIALRASLTIASRALRDAFLPGPDALVDDARLAAVVIERIDDLELALLQLALARENDSLF
jgi:hypothetical protein